MLLTFDKVGNGCNDLLLWSCLFLKGWLTHALPFTNFSSVRKYDSLGISRFNKVLCNVNSYININIPRRNPNPLILISFRLMLISFVSILRGAALNWWHSGHLVFSKIPLNKFVWICCKLFKICLRNYFYHWIIEYGDKMIFLA